ncbi:MAG: hypothetical protein ACQGVK_15065 [Myxococcota bacterium]
MQWLEIGLFTVIFGTLVVGVIALWLRIEFGDALKIAIAWVAISLVSHSVLHWLWPDYWDFPRWQRRPLGFAIVLVVFGLGEAARRLWMKRGR